MAKDRSGYVFQDKKGNWYARTTATGADGKRRNVKRRARDRADAKEILRRLLQQIKDGGAKAVDASRVTFNELADYYERHYRMFCWIMRLIYQRSHRINRNTELRL